MGLGEKQELFGESDEGLKEGGELGQDMAFIISMELLLNDASSIYGE